MQESSTVEDICRPLVDSVKVWEGIAAAEYGLDGVMEGWEDAAAKPPETAEDKYFQVSKADWLHSGAWFLRKLR